MHIKIKICGITQFEDARAAVNMGADALGFVFDETSPRYIVPKMARKIIENLPPFITKVGVFRDTIPQTIIEHVHTAGVDTVQLNGSEPPDAIARLPMPVIKTFSVDQGFDLTILEEYPVAAFLLDTWNRESQSSGPGMTFNWKIVKQAVRLQKNIILAGRLGQSNIKEALDEVVPYGVDICESVEIMPGRKNPQKMGTVIKMVREWK